MTMTRVLRRAVAAAVTLLAVALACRPARADTLFAIYSGKSFTQDTHLTLQQPAQDTRLTFHGVSYQDRSFTDPIYYGGRITHFFKSRPGLGLARSVLRRPQAASRAQPGPREAKGRRA